MPNASRCCCPFRRAAAFVARPRRCLTPHGVAVRSAVVPEPRIDLPVDMPNTSRCCCPFHERGQAEPGVPNASRRSGPLQPRRARRPCLPPRCRAQHLMVFLLISHQERRPGCRRGRCPTPRGVPVRGRSFSTCLREKEPECPTPCGDPEYPPLCGVPNTFECSSTLREVVEGQALGNQWCPTPSSVPVRCCEPASTSWRSCATCLTSMGVSVHCSL